MERHSEFIQSKIEKLEEPKLEKDAHQVAIEAVDALAGLLKKETLSEEEERQIEDMDDIIDREVTYLDYQEDYDFFEIIPFCLKLSKLPTNTNMGVMLSIAGRKILRSGLERVLSEKEGLQKLDQLKVDNLFQALSIICKTGNYHGVAIALDFLEKYKKELSTKKGYAEFIPFLEPGAVRMNLAYLLHTELDKNRDFLDSHIEAREMVVRLLRGCEFSEKASWDILNSWLSRKREKADEPNPLQFMIILVPLIH